MKNFQVRSREVRAASQQLMRELREARAAGSRHKPLAKPAIAAPAQADAPPRASSILPSRKILAADAAPNPAAVPSAKVRAPKEEPATAVEAALPVAPAKPKISKPKGSKPKASKSIVVQTVAAEPRVVPVIMEPEAPPSQVKSARPKKPAKAPKARANVAAIIAEGFAPVAALQQAVSAAIEAKAATDAATLSVGMVPSLGPGMVWRLNQLGLRTLADLAAADAEDLRVKLGKLGRMVNVEQWIAHARAA